MNSKLSSFTSSSIDESSSPKLIKMNKLKEFIWSFYQLSQNMRGLIKPHDVDGDVNSIYNNEPLKENNIISLSCNNENDNMTTRNHHGRHSGDTIDDKQLDILFWSHQKMSAIYWATCSLYLIDPNHLFPKDKIIEFVMSCYHPNGGFSQNVGHDPHILSTLSAIQILVIYDSLSLVNTANIASYISGLQLSDGSFKGDVWGEVDTRFSYCAISALSLIGHLNNIQLEKAIAFICHCKNFDGGYGNVPGGESHAGQIFCCVSALLIAGQGKLIDSDWLGWWLSMRQCPSGGLNGRPEKLEDVCYSWWILSSLSSIDRLHWLSKCDLINFILSCQDLVEGGFSDRPGDYPDIFHTFFALAGLSLLGYDEGLIQSHIDPLYCLPRAIIRKNINAGKESRQIA